ncbi:MAG: hypothetical protein ACRCUT_07920, partial [Spirochaetota bacterium]
PGSIAYYDISGASESGHGQLFKNMCAMENVCWGIIDPFGAEPDPAMLLHSGFIDYIGSDLLISGISAKRFSVIAQHAAKRTGHSFGEGEWDPGFVFKPSGYDWKNVESGEEYSFCCMFVELDKTRELHRSTFDTGPEISVSELFRTYIEKELKGTHGKIWIWMDSSGLLLFPFKERHNDAVLAGIRLMLDRRVFCIEQSISSSQFVFRIAIHAGNIEFRKRGQTGEIVSDVINTVFHLGQKYTDFGDLSISREAVCFAEAGLMKLFTFEGKSEGLQLYRLLRLL